MARKRMIDPSFWTDEKLGECSIQERLLFMGLISNADDEGYGRANPKLLRSLVFPYDDLRASDLEKWLSHLGGLKLVVLYTVNGQAYYYLPSFTKHQTINKPTKSDIPKPEEGDDHDTTVALPEDYRSATVVLPEDYRLIEEKRKEEKGREEKRKEDLLPGAETTPDRPPDRQPVIILPLNDKTEHPVYQEQVEEWAELYPAVDVAQQLRSMKGWLDSNPTKRKTRTGINRFINSWLAKEQNKGGDRYGSFGGGNSSSSREPPAQRRQIGVRL